MLCLSEAVDKERVLRALKSLAATKAKVVIFHVIEVPSRSSPIETMPYIDQVSGWEKRLKETADWLRNQNFDVSLKVVVARDSVHGIVDEADLGDYSLILLLKRAVERGGFARFFRRSVSQGIVRLTNRMLLIVPARY